MINIVVRRRRRSVTTRVRTGPIRLHIVSFRFAAEGRFRRMTTVLLQSRMGQSAAMEQAAAKAEHADRNPGSLTSIPFRRSAPPQLWMRSATAHGGPDFPGLANPTC